MRRLIRYPLVTFLALSVAFLSLTFAFPLFASLGNDDLLTVFSNYSGDGWALPFLRSSAFSLITTITCVPLGFMLALLTKNCLPMFRAPLAILMAPVLMGSVALAFCVKLDVLESGAINELIANRSLIPTWGLMLACQAWQFLTLTTYLFWFRLQQVPTRTTRFSQASHLDAFEDARDVYWPHTRNLAGILALFVATSSFYEFSKFYLILRASPGSGTELASHWLLRLYNFYATVDPRVATKLCLGMSTVGLAFATIVALLAIAITLKGMDVCIRLLAKRSSKISGSHSLTSSVMATLLILGTVLPLLGLGPYVNWRVLVPPAGFSRSALLALLAAVAALLVSISLGISGRLLLRRIMERFDSRSALVFAGLYLLQVIPAIAIALCGYYWLSVLADRVSVRDWVPVLWLICQVIVSLPLTGSFVQANHFRVSTSEINFQESSSVGLNGIVWHTFLRRFPLEYLLVAIFAFSLIWTESTINATLSNLSLSIPSLSVELTQRVDGRGASYSEATGLIVATLFPVVLCLTLWVYDTRRKTHHGYKRQELASAGLKGESHL